MRPVRVVIELHLVWGILLHEGKGHGVAEVNLWLQLYRSVLPKSIHTEQAGY